MSFKMVSKQDIHGVKLDFDVNLETSTLEDLSIQASLSRIYRTLPLTFTANDTEIKGELWFLESAYSKSALEIGVTLYNVDEFSAFFSLELETVDDNIEQLKIGISYKGNNLSCVSKTSTNQKLPANTTYAICKQTFYFPNEIGANVKVNGEITLKIELPIETTTDSTKMKNFKKLLCGNTFARFSNEENFTIICEGEQFGFNKTLLCMISEVFASMIQLPNGQEKLTNSVEIKDFSSDTIRAFQKIVFGEEEDISNELFSPELLLFAQKYFIRPLAEKCKKHLLETLSNENIYEIIRVAYLTDNEEILKMAATYAKENLAELKTSGEWLAFRKSNPDCMFKVYDYMY